MKIPVRFKKLTKIDIEKALPYFAVFGEVKDIGETESYTIFYFYPNKITSFKEDLNTIKHTLCLVGYLDVLIKD